MDSTSTAPGTNPVRDESFYFEDDPMVTFLVENLLFKVHRHFFIQGSTIFRGMFAGGPTAKDQDNTEATVPLSGVTVKEFQTLLRFFYAMALPVSKSDTLAGRLEFNLDEKLALLNIAHRFLFDHIFKYMCQQIRPEEIPVGDRVRLGDQYNLTEWLSSAYEELLGRASLECDTWEDEVCALGYVRVIRILQAKNVTLVESPKDMQNALRGVEEDHRFHMDKCGQGRISPDWTYRSSAGQQSTPAVAFLHRYFYAPLHAPSLCEAVAGSDVHSVQDSD